MALLAAWRFQRNFMAVQEIVTFGAPMIGNEAASQAFGREFPGKIFRYIDLEDLVPHLPTVSLIANAYSHCLSEVALQRRRGRRRQGRPGCPPAARAGPAAAEEARARVSSTRPRPRRSGRWSRAGSPRT